LIIGITGATGTILGVRLLQVLKEHHVETHLIFSNWGELKWYCLREKWDEKVRQQ
jgi:3-polyprenyl-4-hydroxybenzoate decarboxylase